jgi:drug/metabolite transporter (DMT)-like permease
MNIILDLGPLGTALLAWLLLGEVLGSVRIVGMIIVIVGVVLTQIARPADTNTEGVAPS